MAQALGQHEALDLLLCRAAGAGPADAAAVGRAPAEAIIPAQEISQVGAWRAAIRAPPDWADSRGSQRLGYAPRSAAPPAGTLELEHVHGYGGRVTKRVGEKPPRRRREKCERLRPSSSATWTL